ncbi:glutamine cyclotransferase [Aquipluma nitroreducens]|uniref:Glutamine cyclotransferase n=1 Tax=Aquipluma nitroreducens TaxID=2010828 RepID=A0A5K7S9J4_9BACT|nr:glutaminyl-peptide cyclotransferase [Aquipluma nitroreducens]BBE18139.1 glutamine cyclotransferase [Aquipluma nitroreducens]
MNIRLFSTFIVLSVFISSFSCSNKANRSRKPAVRINAESVHKKIVYGDDINISIAVKVKDGELKETNIFVDSVLVTTNKNTEFNYTLKGFKSLGKHTIKAQAVKADGVEGVYFKTFEVLSDVIPEKYGYEVVQTYPHNETSFTEGLEIHDGFIYESTGENGKSFLYKNNLKTGKTVKSVKLADKYFGEGITIFNNKIYQLTYKTKVGFIYNLENMALIDSFHFESTEGWGMTHDEKYLIMDDGTNILTYLDPTTLKAVKKLQVYDDKDQVLYLNELEYSDGFIYANLWTTNLILKIDPQTGKVLAKIDLEGILTLSNTDKQVDVLNGIAIDPVTKKMYVTGKLYPKLFEIKPIKKE